MKCSFNFLRKLKKNSLMIINKSFIMNKTYQSQDTGRRVPCWGQAQRRTGRWPPRRRPKRELLPIRNPSSTCKSLVHLLVLLYSSHTWRGTRPATRDGTEPRASSIFYHFNKFTSCVRKFTYAISERKYEQCSKVSEY
jgi:hypothetical protein